MVDLIVSFIYKTENITTFDVQLTILTTYAGMWPGPLKYFTMTNSIDYPQCASIYEKY